MSENPVLGLWDRHQPRSYPTGVVGIRTTILGTSFFPGGYGLWESQADRPLPDFPVGGVMVLGHDFHSEAGFEASLQRGCEKLTQPTWRNLIDVFERACIPLDLCFFTNFYMGLRQGTQTTGPFPGRNDTSFVKHCRSFFIEQLKTQRPRLIVTLGTQVPHAIASLSPDLDDWGMQQGIRHLDSVGAIRYNVRFDGFPDFVTTVVALIHPSQRHASLSHRRYAGLVGDPAEMVMLNEAMAGAGLADV